MTTNPVDEAREAYVASRAHHQMHGWEGAPPHAEGCHLCFAWRIRNEETVARHFTAGWADAIQQERSRYEGLLARLGQWEQWADDGCPAGLRPTADHAYAADGCGCPLEGTEHCGCALAPSTEVPDAD